MFEIEKLIRALKGVDFVIIGGVAATIHGSAYSTQDFDILYSRTPDNLKRLATAMSPLHPLPRGKNIPTNLPFVFDERTIRQGLNFTFTTDAGDLDLFGEIPGIGSYNDALPNSQDYDLFDMRCKVLELEWLIKAKRAASRPKDVAVIKELQALSELNKNRK